LKKLAIVGLGYWGKNLVSSIHGASELARFSVGVTQRADALSAFAEARQLRLVSRLEEALAMPDIDGIVLTTPDSSHADQVVAAARAGKAVLVEKPFTLTRESADAAAAAVAQAGTVLAFAHNRRFLPAVQEMGARIESGALGQLLHIEGNYSSNYGLRFKPGMWRADRADTIAGGMTGMGIHQVDLMIHLGGKLSRVQAKGVRQVLEVDVEDNVTMLLDFASGATGSFTTLITTSPIFRLRLLGTGGWAEMVGESRLLICEGAGPVQELHYPPVSTERLEIEAFAEAIAGSRRFPVPVDEALHGVSALESVAVSLRSGQAVDIAP
jgi:predicted dehydrogenase